jgi:tetratricopeptide (TPR) repeat protein
MNQTPPAPQLMAAMQELRASNHAAALAMAEAELGRAQDRLPYLAIASLAALRLGQPERAIGHLRDLLALKPDDEASRINLANALVETRQYDAALEICAGAANPAFDRIEGYIHQQTGQQGKAIAAYERAVSANSNDLASWNNLGNLRHAAGDVDGAILAYQHAITLAPREVDIYLNLAEVLRHADRKEQHLKVVTDAQAVAPDNARMLLELGQAQAAMDDLDAAIATFRRAIALNPEFSDAHIQLGMVFETLNRIDDLAELIASVDIEHAPPEAAFLRAWLARREGRFDEAAELACQIPETVHPMRRFHLIGGIADRRDDAEGAFAAFTRMNEEALASVPPLAGPSYRETVLAETARWPDTWRSEWPERAVAGEARDPVFLVGFPRSGTTLLDTMLMGLPELSVLEERPMMARTRKLIAADEDLAALSAERIAELRAAYFAAAREFGWQEGRWLVDKHPLNMDRIPLIHRLFPKAKIILAERHPYDVVLSCFMANFQLNLAMRSFTTLDEAARTYDAVFAAWERATALLPVDHHAVRYERLVSDTEAELRPLVGWLGLEWDDALLDHTGTAKDRGRVRTASYSQIGEKLYTRARYRWRRYADALAPVVPILRPWAEKMGYDGE